MPYFQWTEAMSVGIPALDADHKCLIRTINLLHDLCDCEDGSRVIGNVLDTLKLYGRFHFKREERVMEAAGFPGTEFHRAEHQGFVRYVDLLRKRYGSDGSRQARPGELFDYLTGWLRHHILIQDMAYKPYIRDYLAAEQVARGAAPALPNIVALARA